MGGYGSGRRWSSKKTTSAYRQLDVRRWQREGLLVRSGSFVCGWWHVDVVPPSNIHGQPEWLILFRLDRRDETYPVRLQWTPCNYGGSRVWFHCPVEHCGQRVAILYANGSVACRSCRQLTYQSQQDSAKYRALHRAEDIRQNLGGSPCIVDPFPEKPQGMHWRTYERLALEATRAEMLFLSYL
jgi:hypothetical protein